MPAASLISFTLQSKGRTKGEVNKFYRELYGYENYSYYCRYHSRIKGFLDAVRNVRYSKGIFMVREEDEPRVVRYLRERGAKVTVWEVTPKPKEWRLLQSIAT